MNTKEMLERLERTASLLKELQKEQRMEELVRQAQDLMEKQSDLNQKTGEASEKDAEAMKDLAKQQSELAKQAGELKKNAEDMQSEMDDPSVKQELQQMSQEMQQDGPQEDMQRASSSLQQQQQQSAMQEQQKAMEKMVSLFKRASKAQQMSSMMQGQQMAQSFHKYAKQTLQLSHRQESLTTALKQTSGNEEGAQGLQTISTEQLSYLEATEKVANEINKIASVSLTVSPKLLQSLGEAITRMQSSMLFLEQDKPYMSTTHAHNAVESLNEATIEMLRSAQSCMSGGGGQSMSMQMLQQMIPQQQDVIKETQAMLQMRLTEEALRQQQQAKLDRLAGQQRSLQEIAKQIEQSMKGDRETLGRLDRTIEDMEAVVEALQRGDLDEDLVNREQRILSRLLDAERSVHTRDYEQRRESISAEDVFSKSLGRRADGADAQTLRDEIQRAMQLKAPGEFEDLIRMYFRALADEAPAPAGQRSD